MKNLSPEYKADTTLNMTWFLQDLDLTADEIVEILDTLQNNKDQYGTNTFVDYEYIRAVWALLKARCWYHGKGLFTIPYNRNTLHTVDRCIEIILTPVQIWSRTP